MCVPGTGGLVIIGGTGGLVRLEVTFTVGAIVTVVFTVTAPGGVISA